MADLWNKIRETLSAMMSSTDFKVWIEPLRFDISDRKVTISLQGGNEYMLSRVQEKMGWYIREALAMTLDCRSDALEIHYCVAQKAVEKKIAKPVQRKQPALLLEAVGIDEASYIGTKSKPTSLEKPPVLIQEEKTKKRVLSQRSLLEDSSSPVEQAIKDNFRCLELEPHKRESLLVPQERPRLVVPEEERPRRGRLVAGALLGQPPLDMPITASATALQKKIERFSFDEFVIGPSNAVAAAAAKDVCYDDSGIQTLFLSSNAGLGKTHIAQAVALELQRLKGTGAKIAYLTSEEFYSRFRQGIRGGTVEEFVSQMKKLDFLLFDDVQYLHGKTKTQELLHSIVKYLQNNGCRVIFTSKYHARDLGLLDSQLVSLICSGILTEMRDPTYEMRCEILRRKARVHQVILPNEVTQLLASRLTGDIRQLESCLQTLLLKMRILNAPITTEMAYDVLMQFSPQEGGGVEAVASIDDILAFVCENYRLTTDQLISRLRRRDLVAARNTLFYLARRYTNLTLIEIGTRLNKHHATVLKGIATVEQALESETTSGREMKALIRAIERNTDMLRRAH